MDSFVPCVRRGCEGTFLFVPVTHHCANRSTLLPTLSMHTKQTNTNTHNSEHGKAIGSCWKQKGKAIGEYYKQHGKELGAYYEDYYRTMFDPTYVPGSAAGGATRRM
jgi:hypothetical protein